MQNKSFFIILFFFINVCSLVGSASLSEQCSNEFQKLSPCIPFATAKAAAPTNDCCDMAASARKSHPACLCYIILQIHNGSNPEIKNLGVQEARLIQLPSACKLANTSVSDCPKYLGLPPNSPGAAIFTNSSNASAGTSSQTTSDSSNGFWYQPQIAGLIMAIAMAIFLYAFPLGLLFY
ncbi:Non-specific lipid transfer protein GPI-anchored 1 [Abeliophyllum distichum]|uniref:Non-specific lipid transfer protein GPI-anchored 1 n=1 Tax=Abeliophyllum distichum TaxID=126358 RepID=A0ABD1UHR6_9LAMI